jgi:hypothetical protein
LEKSWTTPKERISKIRVELQNHRGRIPVTGEKLESP